MPRPRSTDTAEFKLAAVKMITDQKLSIAKVARRLNVGENLLREWRKAVMARGDAAFPGPGHPSPAEDDLRRFRAETMASRLLVDAREMAVTHRRPGLALLATPIVAASKPVSTPSGC